MIDVELRPINRDDLECMYRWRNDPEIMARTRQYRMLTWTEHLKWFTNLDPNKNLMYAIMVTAKRNVDSSVTLVRMVGVCGLCYIDWISRSAEISIYIGNREYRRKGVGSTALMILCKVGFMQMNLHRLWAEVYNLDSETYGFPQQFFLNNDFIYEATLTDTVFKNGNYCNSSFYRLLKDEYEKLITG